MCYLDNGKYGHYLNHDGKNYKVPEWLAPEKLDIETAERLIEYKKKMSTQWCEAKTTTKAESESEFEEEAETKKLEIKKIKNLNKLYIYIWCAMIHKVQHPTPCGKM